MYSRIRESFLEWVVIALLAVCVSVGMVGAANVRYNSNLDGELSLRNPERPSLGNAQYPYAGKGVSVRLRVLDGSASDANIFILANPDGSDARRMAYCRVCAVTGDGITVRPFGSAYGDTTGFHLISAAPDSVAKCYTTPFITDSLRIVLSSGTGWVDVLAF